MGIINYEITKRNLNHKMIDSWICEDELKSPNSSGDKLRHSINSYLMYEKENGKISKDELAVLINKAADKKWKLLNLSCLGLECIPSELWKLSSLEVLVLGEITDRNNIYINHFKEKIIFEENALPNLKILLLSGAWLNEMPEGISCLKSLQYIEITLNDKLLSFPFKAAALSDTPVSVLCCDEPSDLHISTQPVKLVVRTIDRITEESSDYKIYATQLSNAFSQYNEFARAYAKAEKLNHFFKYLTENQEREPDKELKVIVCGPKGFGKSSLIEQLFYDEKPFAYDTKENLAENYHKFEYLDDDDKLLYRLNIWEYSIKEYDKKSYPVVFTNDALYLFVWKNDAKNGRNDLEHWLSEFKSKHKKAIVILIITHCDKSSDDITTLYIDDKELNLDIDDKELNSLINEKYAVGRYFTCNQPGDKYDGQTKELKDRIIAYMKGLSYSACSSNGVHVYIKKYLQNINEPFIHYGTLCELMGINDKNELRRLIEHLHRTGAINFYENANYTGDIIIFDLEWLEEAYRKIIEYCQKKNKGVISREEFSNILNYRHAHIYPSYTHNDLLKILDNKSLLSNPEPNNKYYPVNFEYIYLSNERRNQYRKFFETNETGSKITVYASYRYKYTDCLYKYEQNPQELFDFFFSDRTIKTNFVQYEMNRGYVCVDNVGLENSSAYAHITWDNTNDDSISIKIYTHSDIAVDFQTPLVAEIRNKIESIKNKWNTEPKLNICCTKCYPWQTKCNRKEPCEWDYENIKIKSDRIKYFKRLCDLDLCPNETLVSDVLRLDLL